VSDLRLEIDLLITFINLSDKHFHMFISRMSWVSDVRPLTILPMLTTLSSVILYTLPLQFKRMRLRWVSELSLEIDSLITFIDLSDIVSQLLISIFSWVSDAKLSTILPILTTLSSFVLYTSKKYYDKLRLRLSWVNLLLAILIYLQINLTF
jgi:hypothetical protein